MRVLALDTGSSLASVAAVAADRVAQRSLPQRESAAPLLGLVAACLDDLGLRIADLDALVALAGPGSFTGLRVGLATVLGLHQATGIPAGAIPTLPVLASTAPDSLRSGPVAAAVDAFRGEWFVQRFVDGTPADEIRRLDREALAAEPAATWTGFGITSVEGLSGSSLEPPPLALHAARWVAERPTVLDPATLTHPLYLQLPVLAAPRPPKRVGTA